MCSPKVSIAKEDLKRIVSFKDLILNEVPNIDGTYDLISNRKGDNSQPKFICNTEYPSIKVAIYRGVLTYYVEIIFPEKKVSTWVKKDRKWVLKSSHVKDEHRRCDSNAHKLALWADRLLLSRGQSPQNVLKSTLK